MSRPSDSSIDALKAKVGWSILQNHLILIASAVLLLLLAMHCIPECPPP
jgi:hypothetical protein